MAGIEHEKMGRWLAAGFTVGSSGIQRVVHIPGKGVYHLVLQVNIEEEW